MEITHFVAVDDCGRQLNPMIVAGQVHGGIAQGIGQALCEGVIYGEDDNCSRHLLWITRCRFPQHFQSSNLTIR